MSSDLENNYKYFKREYWDERYRSEEAFDWFVTYERLSDLVKKNVHLSDKILNLGCGNSLLPIDMYKDGFHNILNIDYSNVIIAEMEKRYQDLPEMGWSVMDIRDMSELESQSFDVVIEKGTLDSLLVSEKSPWTLSDDAEDMMDDVLSEVSRLLKPGGRFISVTFAQPHFRLPLFALEKYGWDIHTDTIGEHFHFFFYTMQKGAVLSHKNRTVRTQYLKRKTESHDVTPVSESEDEDFLLNLCVL